MHSSKLCKPFWHHFQVEFLLPFEQSNLSLNVFLNFVACFLERLLKISEIKFLVMNLLGSFGKQAPRYNVYLHVNINKYSVNKELLLPSAVAPASIAAVIQRELHLLDKWSATEGKMYVVGGDQSDSAAVGTPLHFHLTVLCRCQPSQNSKVPYLAQRPKIIILSNPIIRLPLKYNHPVIMSSFLWPELQTGLHWNIRLFVSHDLKLESKFL